MKFSEFHRQVTTYAEGHHRVPVGQRMLRDWVFEYQFRSKPGSHTWTADDFRWATFICDLRARGVVTENETIIHLWLRGLVVPLDRLRRALIEELSRLRWLLLDPINSTYDGRSSSEPTARNVKAIARKAGSASPEIHPAGFKWPDANMVEALGLLRYGSEARRSLDLFSPLIDLTSVNRALQALGSESAVDPAYLLAGMVGDPLEIEDSGEASISEADETTFERARKMFQTIRFATAIADRAAAFLPRPLFGWLSGFAKPARRISKAFDEPNWGSLMLAVCVHYHHRKVRPRMLQTRTVTHR